MRSIWLVSLLLMMFYDFIRVSSVRKCHIDIYCVASHSKVIILSVGRSVGRYLHCSSGQNANVCHFRTILALMRAGFIVFAKRNRIHPPLQNKREGERVVVVAASASASAACIGGFNEDKEDGYKKAMSVVHV